MRSFAVVLVFLVSLFLLPACGGGGGGGGTGGGNEAVRSTLRALLVAAVDDNFSAAAPHLDVASYLYAIESDAASRYDQMSPDERTKQAQNAFRQFNPIREMTKIKDAAGIDSALATATYDVLTQTKSANVRFQAPDSERAGTITFRAQFTLTPGGAWKLVRFVPEF